MLQGEVWVQFACEPEYLYDIEVIGKKGEHIEEINGDWCAVPDWDIKNPRTRSPH